MEPCHALVCGCGGVFLERVPAGVAFGLFGGSSGFLFGVGGLVAAGPEVDLLRDRVDGYGCGVLFADLLDGFFGGAGGRGHAADEAPFRVAVGWVGDEVDAVVGLHEERGDRFDPLPVAVVAFDVAEDVVEVRGAGRLRELLLPVRLAVISRYGHELADGELAEIVAGCSDLVVDAGGLGSVTHVVAASSEPVGDAGGGGPQIKHALDGVGLLQHGELFALAVLGDHGLELLQWVEVKHEAWDGSGSGLFACGESAVSGDDAVAAAVGHDAEGCEEAVGFDAGGEVGHVADVFAWIVGVWVDQARVDELDFVALVVAHCFSLLVSWLLRSSAHAWHAFHHSLGLPLRRLPVWSYSSSCGSMSWWTCSQFQVCLWLGGGEIGSGAQVSHWSRSHVLSRGMWPLRIWPSLTACL